MDTFHKMALWFQIIKTSKKASFSLNQSHFQFARCYVTYFADFNICHRPNLCTT